MAAATTVVLALLEPGQTVALAEGAYYGTGAMLAELARWGVRHVEFDQTGPPPAGADLVWIEAPSNPFLTMPDFEAAAAHPGLVVCDSTAATPLQVRPLELRLRLRRPLRDEVPRGPRRRARRRGRVQATGGCGRLLESRSRTGPVADADTAWLLLRGLETLEVRVARQTETRDGCSRSGFAAIPPSTIVRYPGFGGLMSFDVADAESPDGSRRRRG